MKIESFVHSCLALLEQPLEVVEIKGRGHPDTVCDLICEKVSSDLLQFYQSQCGRPLHYNVDKALLVGGRAAPKFGGGSILEPAKFYLGDRATNEFKGRHLPLQEIVRSSVAGWLDENIRFLRLDSNLQFFNEIRPGSESLSAVEERHTSNDTSVGVGSWPRTALESAVLNLERHLNSENFKSNHPETGEDIKIMGVRTGHQVKVICAIAFVDRYISSLASYLENKRTLVAEIDTYLSQNYSELKYSVEINTLDNPGRNEAGLHLTVTGLSSENGDSGQVGRGNRVNGVISFMRPQTMEAWAGKNPITHVGKIYSFAAQNLAKRLCGAIPEIAQADVFLVGQIGRPVEEPAHAYANIVCHDNSKVTGLTEKANHFLRKEIEKADLFQVRNLMGAI